MMGSLILIAEQRWNNLSSSALVNIGSSKTLDYLENTRLVIVEKNEYSRHNELLIYFDEDSIWKYD